MYIKIYQHCKVDVNCLFIKIIQSNVSVVNDKLNARILIIAKV